MSRIRDLIASVAMIAVLFIVVRAGFQTLLAWDDIAAKAAW